MYNLSSVFGLYYTAAAFTFEEKRQKDEKVYQGKE